MAAKRYSKAKKSRKGTVALAFGGVACTVAIAAACVSFATAPAGASNSGAADFGLNEVVSAEDAQTAAFQNPSDLSAGESTLLTKSASRDISQAIDEMNAKEEAERKAAEEARLAAEAAKKAELDALQAQSAANAAVANLEPVDWTLSHDDFVAQWSSRIDAYLAGSPLSGQGTTFAEAAWEYGVDPRLSPSISNTESTKGAHCFLPYNAWGWGSSSWSSWEEAIYAHVKGLHDGYGSMITLAGAQKYCPPTASDWFAKTTSQMQLI